MRLTWIKVWIVSNQKENKKADIEKEITKILKKDNKKKGINDNKGKCIEPNASHTRKKTSIA